MRCNENNCCMGSYGKSIDVKITNNCNAKCKFCIEKNGYSPIGRDLEKMIQNTIKETSFQNVLILGGEPLVSGILEDYLKGIFDFKENIYLTTNGSLLNKEKAEMLSKYLKAINISIHHYLMERNDGVYGIHIDFEKIKEAIHVFKKNRVKTRMNCNLIKGLVETLDDINNMILLGNELGFDEIRFNELQNAEEVWVGSRNIFGELLNEDPYSQGCEQVLKGYDFSIKVSVKQTCGIVNKKAIMPIVEKDRHKIDCLRVIYPNGEIYNGWVLEKSAIKSKKKKIKKQTINMKKTKKQKNIKRTTNQKSSFHKIGIVLSDLYRTDQGGCHKTDQGGCHKMAKKS